MRALFAESASLFSGKIFVQLVVYADESGTGDLKNFKSKGAKVAVVSGYVDFADNWIKFVDDWQQILRNYNAPYFHFYETLASNRAETSNPYHGWNNNKIDDFIHDLAMITVKSAVPIGGHSYGEKLKTLKADIAPIRMAFEQFYESLFQAIRDHWPKFNDKITFIYDQQPGNSKWLSMLNDVHCEAKKKDQRIGGLASEDMRLPKNSGLQAADMNAYTTRQASDKFYTTNHFNTGQQFRILDIVLQRNGLPRGHPLRFEYMDNDTFKLFISMLRRNEKDQKRTWSSQGKKKIYYPQEHIESVIATMNKFMLKPIVPQPSR